MYESCLTRIADEVHRRGKTNVSVMVASHNEDTVRFALNLMKEKCISPSERVMCMAQLYGMCDQVCVYGKKEELFMETFGKFIRNM